MRALLFGLALAMGLAHAEGLLAPGIYRLNEPAAWSAPRAPDEAEVKRRFVDMPALPSSAKIRYAVVAKGEKQNMVFFLTAPGWHGSESAERICRAYGFPDWHDYASDLPICSGDPGRSEPSVTRQGDLLSLDWPELNDSEQNERIPPTRKPTSDEQIACMLDNCNPEAFGRWIRHEKVTRRHSDFSLLQSRDYRDILYLSGSTALHHSADTSGFTESLPQDSFAAVQAVDGDWLKVDAFDHEERVKSGWILRADALGGQWVEQAARHPRFRFRVLLSEGDENGLGRLPLAIEARDRRSGKVAQTLYDISAMESRSADEDVVQLVDVNFDGELDLLVLEQAGGAGPNDTHNVYVFNKRTGRFERNAKLSELPQLQIDAKRKRILSASRGGCCSHSSETYRYFHGRLTLVSSWDESLSYDDGGSVMVTTVRRLVKGKWRTKIHRKRM
ncbi:XAC2610-related protein [Chromobacterium piscinae]|uniref:XAC2610-related protein n=1 Tax=Chromobacterium piscinae TaxID=686831 RepID=UPI003F7DB2D5